MRARDWGCLIFSGLSNVRVPREQTDEGALTVLHNPSFQFFSSTDCTISDPEMLTYCTTALLKPAPAKTEWQKKKLPWSIVVAVKDIVQSAEHHSEINPDTCLLRIHIYIPAEKDQLWPQSIPMLVQACLEITNSLKVTAVTYVTEAGDEDVCGNTDGWKVTASAMWYRQLSLMTLFF